MIPRDVINQARDADSSFDKQSTPDAVALRFLARYQQGLLAEIARWKRDALHSAQTIALPLADFTAGTALNAHLSVHGVTANYTDADRQSVPVRLVEYPLKLDRYPDDDAPTAYIQARSIFLLGEKGDFSVWDDMVSVTVDLFPQGPDTLALDTALILPGSPQRACVDALAGFMAGRAKVRLGFDPSVTHEQYLDEVTERTRAKVTTIREVW